MLNTSHNSEQSQHNKGTQDNSHRGKNVRLIKSVGKKQKEGGRIEAIQASANQSICFSSRRAVTGFTFVGGKANTVKH